MSDALWETLSGLHSEYRYILLQDGEPPSRGRQSDSQVEQQHGAHHHHQAAEGRVEVDDAQQNAAARHRVQPVQPITVELVVVEHGAALRVHLEVGVGRLVVRQWLGLAAGAQRGRRRDGLVGWSRGAWQGGGGGGAGWSGGSDRCLTDGEKKENGSKSHRSGGHRGKEKNS